MKYLTTNEIRKIWLDFWLSKDHLEIKPKSLVPFNDDSLLFINSGVATLKPYLSGQETPPSKRIVNSQKSLRTNDIENVGVTARHHTFFEMLGNFSIGDYFKEEAIEYAWELITDKKYYSLDKSKIYITIHPKDGVSLQKWLELGVDPSKIVKTHENFWEIGKGPGGPNTEIFYDRGEKYDTREPYKLLEEDIENDRVVEIWNIVFSQYNCDPDKKQEDYEELPQKNIDTGMGLERMACIIQESETNFETDNFKIIIEQIEKITKTKYSEHKKAYRIIADHIRALTFAISDGVEPSNEGRGYVLRRILRRAVKYAYIDLDIKKPLLYNLVDAVIEQMNSYYPTLEEKESIVKEIVLREEEQFLKTIKEGFKHLTTYLEKVKYDEFPAEQAFKLYDTYGFPYELTKEILEENHLKLDEKKFSLHLEEQRERARKSRKDVSTIKIQNNYLSTLDIPSEFVGYDDLELNTNIVLITDTENSLDLIKKGDSGFIILDKTPFYATSGGQEKDEGESDAFTLINVTKLPQGQHLHEVVAKKDLKVGDKVHVKVDVRTRKSIAKNHSATHLLHYALTKVFGDSLEQAGSFQDAQKTRFDFTFPGKITKDQLKEIQNIVNEQIDLGINTDIQNMGIQKAQESGAKALFGEKYGEIVRVVKIGDSIELCGGTHISNTSDINKFYIKSEQSIGSGIHRIEALTDFNVDKYKDEILKKINTELTEKHNILKKNKLIKLDEVDKNIEILKQINEVTKNININHILDQRENVYILNERLKINLEKETKEKIENLINVLSGKAKSFEDTVKIDENINGISNKDLKQLSDKLLEKLTSGIVILRLAEEDKISIIIKVSEDISQKYHAGKILKSIIDPLGGHGGGKATMAQGGVQIKE